ncbi:SPASM domain-containing protein, partial [Thermodesulfobacteriota bacterium]
LLYRKETDYPIKDKINGISNRIIGKYILPIKRNEGKCVAPWLGQLRISQEGIVRLCCGTPFVIGNINNATLFEIWNSKKIRNIRKSFKRGIYPKACGYCRGFSIDNYPKNAFTKFESSFGNDHGEIATNA